MYRNTLKWVNSVVILIISSLLFSSCADTKVLPKSVAHQRVSLGYKVDNIYFENDQSTLVAFKGINAFALDSLTVVDEVNKKLFPFIVYNYQEVNYEIKLGQSTLEQPYNEFFNQSFSDETQRKGYFSLTENAIESPYLLEITLADCDIKMEYQLQSSVIFFLFFYSMSLYEYGFPTQADLTFLVTLKKDDKLLFEKEYTFEKELQFLRSKYASAIQMRHDAVANMVDALSLCTRDCVKAVVVDINRTIEIQKEQLYEVLN